MRKFEQDSIYISFVLDMNEDDFEHIRRYYGIANNQNNIDYFNFKDNPLRQCYSSHGLTSATSFRYTYLNEDDFDTDEITYIKFICNNITLDQIMDKNFFHYNYLGDGIDIELRQFFNSSRYSIGYLLMQKIIERNESFQICFDLSN